MEKRKTAETSGFWNYLMPCGALILSYMLLFYLPEEFSWKTWIIFGTSVFMFCIGYFKLLMALPEPKSSAGAIARQLVLITTGLSLFIGGIYYVYSNDGSEKSIAIATLCLIESMVMCGLSGTEDSSDPSQNNLLRKFCRMIIVFMIVGGGWFFYKEFAREDAAGRGYIEAATMLWIAAASLWYSQGSHVDSGAETNSGKKQNN